MMNEELLCSMIAQPILHSSFIILHFHAVFKPTSPDKQNLISTEEKINQPISSHSAKEPGTNIPSIFFPVPEP